MATKYRGVANPDLAAAMLGKRLSSAASPHKDRRDRRSRTRGAQLRRALAD